jgi:hypothetical protein
MVARLQKPNDTPSAKREEGEESLLVTLRETGGAVLEQATALDPADAVRCAIRLLSRRPFLRAGDTLKVTRPANGDIHQPREMD